MIAMGEVGGETNERGRRGDTAALQGRSLASLRASSSLPPPKLYPSLQIQFQRHHPTALLCPAATANHYPPPPPSTPPLLRLCRLLYSSSSPTPPPPLLLLLPYSSSSSTLPSPVCLVGGVRPSVGPVRHSIQLDDGRGEGDLGLQGHSEHGRSIPGPSLSTILLFSTSSKSDICPAASPPGFSLRPIKFASVSLLVCWLVGWFVHSEKLHQRIRNRLSSEWS